MGKIMKKPATGRVLLSSAITLCVFSSMSFASSHREAPFIAGSPKVDGTDFYMFRSYEQNRDDFVTLIANYQPLQDAYGGPNYFTMDPNALYEIHIDNDGDAVEDLTFQFRFNNQYGQANIPGVVTNGEVDTGAGGVQVPLAAVGGGSNTTPGALNVVENYTVSVVTGDRRSGSAQPITAAGGNTSTFTKPVDNMGEKTIPDYAGYAQQFTYNIDVPGCNATGAKLFVGQRREGFVVNLGEVFDQISLNPLGARNSRSNTIGDKNVTSLALELPVECLTNGSDPVIGAWTTASKPQGRVLNPSPAGPTDNDMGKGPAVESGAWTQVSRLGNPLVNEVVIGITDKDKFNASEPKDDVENFGSYVLYPTLPALVEVLFGVPAPAPEGGRADLLAVFVTGVTTGPNDTPADFKFTAPANLTTPGEMLRLNTAIDPVIPGSQGYSDLGFLGCDLAGFPNGRRVTDDVVDIALTVAEGALLGENNLQTCDLSGDSPAVANGGAVVNDGALPDNSDYSVSFPYLATPIPGSPNESAATAVSVSSNL
ncbi:protein of unknown function (DUF4331) [Spongiibacter sp. IMCC21906]|jgi:hypothetical protein|nr:protein of unknown function (DUF4331) [Spongiibacter sp. IMCC21906]